MKLIKVRNVWLINHGLYRRNKVPNKLAYLFPTMITFKIGRSVQKKVDQRHDNHMVPDQGCKDWEGMQTNAAAPPPPLQQLHRDVHCHDAARL